MNHDEFTLILGQEGYPEPVEVLREPNGHLEHHTHPFEVKALVLSGSIELTINGTTSHYSSGSVFHLGFEEAHAETYGPQGVHYLAARK